MKISDIIEIPVFVSQYINKDIDNIDYHLHSFCNLLLTNNISAFGTEENETYKIEYAIPEQDFSVRYFINFYLEKSTIDNKGNCLYELETDLPKSLTNELFEIKLSTDDGSDLDSTKVYIDSFTSDKLILKSI
jgi:hypothetical protein